MESITNSAWTVGTTAFGSVFAMLSMHFEPTMAFALSLVVLAAVKKF